jgi:hypothetical protein
MVAIQQGGCRLSVNWYENMEDRKVAVKDEERCIVIKRWRLGRSIGSSFFLCVLISGVIFVVQPTSALAKTYATADWSTTMGATTHAPQNQGGYANMYIAPGVAYDWSSGGHINQTIWVATDNSTSVGTYWVEGGYTYGYGGSNVLTYYWAHRSPIYGYAQHNITSITPAVGYWEPIQIKYVGNNAWNICYNWKVETGPDSSSTATGNGPWSYGMVTGLESTSQTSYLTNAKAFSLQWLDLQGVWHTGWNTTNNPSFLYTISPAHASWNTQYQSITDGQ